jgi:lauroyl/myristoyl acyltransferase
MDKSMKRIHKTIDLQSILNSLLGVELVSFVGRRMPPSVGYRIADLMAGWIANRRQSRLVRGIRTNQWMICGGDLDKEALDQAVRDNLKNIAHSLYSLYHYIHDPKAIRDMVDLDPVARSLVERPEFSDRGLMLVGLHLSNFDFVLQSMCMQGLKAFVLTIPDPHGGHRMEYKMRKRTGMNLVPASVGALRNAVRYLERGGVVLTGIDRPVPDPKAKPRFFGRAASLPTHHIYLAMKASVPVMVAAAKLGRDGCYHVRTSKPIEMESYSDHENGIMRNAERVLKEAERFILQTPEQWNMSLPVWPDLMEGVPM